jgi:hypothetical protein
MKGSRRKDGGWVQDEPTLFRCIRDSDLCRMLPSDVVDYSSIDFNFNFGIFTKWLFSLMTLKRQVVARFLSNRGRRRY